MHPRVNSKVQFEINEAYRDLDLTDKATKIPENDTAKLPYLAPVLKSMHLSPPSCTRCSAASLERDYKLEPHHLPAGLYAGITPCATNRSREISGEDADDFMPER
jgi:cytochrome P450